MSLLLKILVLACASSIAVVQAPVASQQIRPEVQQMLDEMNKPFLLESEMRDGNPKYIFFKLAVRAKAVSECAAGADLVTIDEALRAFDEWLSDHNAIKLDKADLSRMKMSAQFFNGVNLILRNVGCDALFGEDVNHEDSMRPYLEPYFNK